MLPSSTSPSSTSPSSTGTPGQTSSPINELTDDQVFRFCEIRVTNKGLFLTTEGSPDASQVIKVTGTTLQSEFEYKYSFLMDYPQPIHGSIGSNFDNNKPLLNSNLRYDDDLAWYLDNIDENDKFFNNEISAIYIKPELLKNTIKSQLVYYKNKIDVFNMIYNNPNSITFVKLNFNNSKLTKENQPYAPKRFKLLPDLSLTKKPGDSGWSSAFDYYEDDKPTPAKKISVARVIKRNRHRSINWRKRTFILTF